VKELNQDNFNMKIVEDLGMSNGTRYAIFECGNCKIQHKRNVKQIKYCSNCTFSNGKRLIEINTPLKNEIHYRHLNIVDRCYNKESRSYRNYDAKGVTICAEWLQDPSISVK
jgi:hypothetical protein